MLADFVVETAVNPGTGATVTLAGAAGGSFRTFASFFPTGSKVFYDITDEIAQRETGFGTFTAGSPNTLTRDQVYQNTSGTTARLNFTGTVFVMNTLPASHAVYIDQNGALNVTGILGTALANSGNVVMLPGDATHPGLVAFYNAAGVRIGYIGSSSGETPPRLLLVAEGGYAGYYVQGTLQVQGVLTAAAGINVSGGPLTVTGQDFAARNVSSVVNVNAGARLRASLGAFNSGDLAAASILADWTRFWDGAFHMRRAPDGEMIIVGSGVSAGDNVFTFPWAFPNACTGVFIQFQSANLALIGTVYAKSAANFNLTSRFWNGTTFVSATGGYGFNYLAIGF